MTGGLVQWDRMTQAAQRYPLEFVVDGIRAEGDSLRLETRGGYTLFRGGGLAIPSQQAGHRKDRREVAF